MLRSALRSVARRDARSMSMAAVKLPDLPYDFGALQPVISGEIMQLHHGKHHAAYVANFNAALGAYAEAEHKGDVGRMIALQPALKFNGGGHVNHSIFWKNLCPPKDYAPPSGDVLRYIEKDFGSLEALVKKFSAASWLGYDKESDRLVVGATANQDPCSTLGLAPLLGVDVWEHAYYLQYKNVRPDYVKAIWEVVSWKNVADNLAQVKKA